MSYYDDARVQAADRWLDALIAEMALPTKFAVCPTCSGHGKHVNPSIDCDGLSYDDFAADPGFYAEYRSGVYDVTCYGCDGERVVKEVDRTRCGADLLARFDAEVADVERDRWERDAERRMGA